MRQLLQALTNYLPRLEDGDETRLQIWCGGRYTISMRNFTFNSPLAVSVPNPKPRDGEGASGRVMDEDHGVAVGSAVEEDSETGWASTSKDHDKVLMKGRLVGRL